MMTRGKRFVRDWVPPALLPWIRRSRGQSSFTGDYGSWAEASGRASGYEDPGIFEKAVAAARAVRDGHAAFERDTVLFSEPAIHGPLLAGLLRAAALNGGQLDVVDFGGAFGSAWWQHRAWLENLPSVRWEVVEQPRFVQAGQREFEAGPLRFRASLDACAAPPASALILLSSVLPYLENPHALLADVVRRGFRHVLIDRTGFIPGPRDRLTVQRVPPSIYQASYPCWFFARERLLPTLAADYRIVAEWRSFDAAERTGEFRGLLLDRR